MAWLLQGGATFSMSTVPLDPTVNQQAATGTTFLTVLDAGADKLPLLSKQEVDGMKWEVRLGLRMDDVLFYMQQFMRQRWKNALIGFFSLLKSNLY